MEPPAMVEAFSEVGSTVETGVVAGKVADALGVTRQTIANWRAEGCPSTLDTRGMRVYDLEAVRAWAKEHKGYGGRGGKRSGAGRPRGSTRTADVKPPLFAEAEQAAVMANTPLTAENIEAKLASGTATPAQVKMLKDMLGAMQTKREMDVTTGELVSAVSVKNMWSKTLSELRRELDGLPGKIVQVLQVSLKLDDGQAKAARAAAVSEVNRLLATLAGPEAKG